MSNAFFKVMIISIMKFVDKNIKYKINIIVTKKRTDIIYSWPWFLIFILSDY